MKTDCGAMSSLEGSIVLENGTYEKSLCELRDLVRNEKKLFIGDDDKILRRYLHYSDLDVRKAFEKMKSVYSLKCENTQWFATEVLTEGQKVALSQNVHCLLKDRDQLGRRVYVLRLGNVVIGEVEPWVNFQVDDLWLELAMDENETHKNGLVYIFDMKNLTWRYMRYFTPQNCKVASSKAEGIPVRKMEYHVINSGFLLNSMANIVFPFLSGSTKQNIHFHKSNMASLHKFVTPDILPEEYGGKQPPLDYDELRSHFIYGNESRLKELVSYGYTK